MNKRGILVIGFLIGVLAMGLANAEIVTNTYSVNKSICRGGTISPSDCTANVSNSDNNRYPIESIQISNPGFINGTWNITLPSGALLLEVIGIFESQFNAEDGIIEWYFKNKTSGNYQTIGCPNGTLGSPKDVDKTNTCNLTNIYKTVISLQDIILENKLTRASGGTKTYLIDHFAINVTYVPDVTPPQITIISPLNQTYASTIIDLNVSLNENGSWCGFSLDNAANVSMTFLNATYFNYTKSGLNIGQHIIIFSCNDSAGNMNFTQVRSFAIDNIPPSFSNYIENPANGSSYSSGQIYRFNVTVNETNIAKVWIEWQNTNYTNGNITNISNVYFFNITNLAAGTYFYRWWANDSLGNLNNSGIRYYIIKKADNNLTLLSSAGWTYNYGTETTFSCFAVYEIPKLYINNTEVNNPTAIILAAGLHNIKCNISESQNYSGSNGMSQGALTVSKASSKTSLTFDKSSPQTYETSITPTCSRVIGEGNVVSTLNGNIINSGEEILLGAGTWNFNCSLAESQNYSASSNLSQFIINPESTTTNVIVNPDSPIDYGTESNFSCSNSVGLDTILYINGNNKNNEKELNVLRAASNYTINCSFAGNQNYSASSEQISYTINKAIGNINLYLNGQENNITIDYPQQYNITATTLYGSVVIYFNGTDITADNGLNVTPSRASGYYNITAVSSGDENHSSETITRWLNVTLDEIPPEINIISPQEGGSYGYNTSLPLTFSVSDEHLDSCWYNLNNGNNLTIPNCENTTFNASIDGSYTLYLYANDSLGNIIAKNVTFSVLVDFPTIILNSPIGIYLNSNNVVFRYTPSDLDLASCELWGDFDGEFKLNQTDIAPISGIANTFSLTLGDGTYIWNIKCNDSIGHSAVNGNKTFYIDTTLPSIIITEPKGTKSSWTGIPLAFTINDSSPVNCWYNVNWATGVNVLPNTSLTNCNSVTFNLSSVGDYILNFYVTDFAGNFKSESSSFTVSTTQSANLPSSGGGGGGGSVINISAGKGKLELSKISNLIVNPGESRKMVLSAKNIGKNFLNDCKLIGKGENAGWISSEGLKGLSVGEKYDFIFTLKVPEGLKVGSYNLELSLACQEYTESISFIAEIIEKKLAIELIKAEREDKDKVRIVYSLSELSGVDQDVETEIVLFGKGNERLAEIRDTKHIEANSKKEFEAMLNVAESLEGSFNLLINGVSQISSTFVQEEIVLGASRVGGFAIFGGVRGETVFSIVLVTIFIIFSIFILRRIFKFRKLKKTGHRKGAMMIDSRVVEKLKKQLEGQNHKGKWIHVKK